MAEDIKKRFSFTYSAFFIASVSVSILCICCIAPAYINPVDFWEIALFGLLFHYVYPVNFLFLLISLYKRKRVFIFSFIPFILGLQTFMSVFQFRLPPSENKTAEASSIKVLSFNVRLFDLYNWSNSGKQEIIFFRCSIKNHLIFFVFRNFIPPIKLR